MAIYYPARSIAVERFLLTSESYFLSGQVPRVGLDYVQQRVPTLRTCNSKVLDGARYKLGTDFGGVHGKSH